MNKLPRPLGNRLLVEPIEVEQKTASGLYIPDTAQEKPQIGVVVAVGPGTKDEEMEVSEGDSIYFGKYSGTEITVNGKEYLIMRQSDAFCII
jgi:chaperonin GroES